MAAITAKDVAELRKKTGIGMMECKKALVEADGDMEAAVKILREKGELKAESKMATRIAADGIVDILKEGDKTAIIEVNTETDFVAKNADFQAFVKGVVNQALATESTDIDAFLAEAWNEDASVTVNDVLTNKIATIGEKLSIRRFEKVVVDNGTVVSYIHGGGRIGVLVAAETAVVNDEIKEALKNLAMQVAALSAKYVSQADVDADYIAHEKEIILAQIMNDPKESQKPEKVINGMIMGRINKQMKEICLLDQVYVKAEDGKQTVAQYLAEVGKANGTEIKIQKFIRFETGEGIEKKVDDFAAEVAAQMGN